MLFWILEHESIDWKRAQLRFNETKLIDDEKEKGKNIKKYFQVKILQAWKKQKIGKQVG
jgi:hypothetical protein